MKKMRNNLFVSFEGIDGCGKTFLTKQVSCLLQKANYDVLFFNRDNLFKLNTYHDKHMKSLANLIWNYPDNASLTNFSNKHWLCLLVAWFDRLTHWLVDLDNKKKNTVIITDGWYYKYLARFMLKESSIVKQAKSLFHEMCRPNLVFYFDLSPDVVLTRKKTISQTESGCLDGVSSVSEQGFIAYQTKVMGQLEKLLESEGWKPLAYSQLIDKNLPKLIFQQIKTELKVGLYAE